MRLLKIAFFAGLFLFVQSHAIAQNDRPSGYLGKRFFIGIPLSYCPNIAGALNAEAKIDYNNVSKFYMFNSLRTGVSMGMVTGNYRTLVLDIDFQRIGVSNNILPSNFYVTNAPSEQYDYATANVTGFRLKFLKSAGHCAPIGVYGGPVLIFNTINTEAKTNTGFSMSTGQVLDFGIGFTGGFRRVFNDRVMVDLGIEYGILFNSFKYFLKQDTDYYTNIKARALYKNAWNTSFPCKLAVYYLF